MNGKRMKDIKKDEIKTKGKWGKKVNEVLRAV
jgi:hypothetical protein